MPGVDGVLGYQRLGDFEWGRGDGNDGDIGGIEVSELEALLVAINNNDLFTIYERIYAEMQVKK